MISKRNVNNELFRATVRSSFSLKQCIIKQLLDPIFVMSGIIKVSVSVICLSYRLWLIILTSTLIIPDIKKVSPNNYSFPIRQRVKVCPPFFFFSVYSYLLLCIALDLGTSSARVHCKKNLSPRYFLSFFFVTVTVLRKCLLPVF